MMTINVLVAFLPLLPMMAALWINCHCLDTLPKHAFAEARHHTRWAAVFLALIITQVAIAGYMAVEEVKIQFEQSMEVGK